MVGWPTNVIRRHRWKMLVGQYDKHMAAHFTTSGKHCQALVQRKAEVFLL